MIKLPLEACVHPLETQIQHSYPDVSNVAYSRTAHLELMQEI